MAHCTACLQLLPAGVGWQTHPGSPVLCLGCYQGLNPAEPVPAPPGPAWGPPVPPPPPPRPPAPPGLSEAEREALRERVAWAVRWGLNRES